MYYLRKEPYEIHSGERTMMTNDRAIYRSREAQRFYRWEFLGLDKNPTGMKLYKCKTLRPILNLRKRTYEYCGEWFDVYDENDIVHGKWEEEDEAD